MTTFIKVKLKKSDEEPRNKVIVAVHILGGKNVKPCENHVIYVKKIHINSSYMSP